MSKELYDAVRYGGADEVKMLLEKGADVNYKYSLGYTALHWACRRFDSVEVIDLMVSQGANVNAKDFVDQTLLHCAAGNDTGAGPAIIEYLVKHGAFINAQYKGGFTPLHSACCSSEWIKNVEALLRNGADVTITDHRGRTPLDFARVLSAKNIVNLLERHIKKLKSKEEEREPPNKKQRVEHEEHKEAHVVSDSTKNLVAITENVFVINELLEKQKQLETNRDDTENRLRKQLRSENHKSQQLQKELDILKNQKKKQFQKLEDENKQLQEDNKQLRNDKKQLRNDKKQLQVDTKKLRGVKRKNDELVAENETLKKNFQTVSREKEHAETIIAKTREYLQMRNSSVVKEEKN